MLIGDWDNQSPDGTEQIFEIEQLINYPGYKGDFKVNKSNFCRLIPCVFFVDILKDDVALVRVKLKNGQGIQFTDYVQAACLPAKDVPYTDGMKCVVSGWGSVGIRKVLQNVFF